MNAMGQPEQERMDALTEAILRLVRRQQETEQRLDRIEHSLGLQPGASAHAAPPPVLPQAEETPPLPRAPEIIPPSPAESTPPPQAPPAATASGGGLFETRVGLLWLNRVGVITLVLGIAFFFKYAVDNRWIGERGRVFAGVLAGLATVGLAERFRRRDERIFAQGICGAGIAILYVSFYAAYGFYQLVPHGLAFLLMALNTAAAGMLALRYGSAAIAALGLAGGYLTPLVLSTGEDRPWPFLGYVLLLGIGAVVFSRFRNWRVLELLAVVATLFLYWSWLLGFHNSDKPAATFFALAFYALFAAGRVPWLALVGQLAFTETIFAVWSPHALRSVSWALLLSVAGLILAGATARRALPLTTLASFWLPYAISHFELKHHNPHEVVFALITVAFFVFFTWTPWRVLRTGRADTGDLTLSVLNAAAYFSASYDLLHSAYGPYLGLLAAALALLHLGVAREIRRVVPAATLYAGVAACFTTLAIPIQFSAWRVTIAWALEAAALAWIGARAASRKLIWIALAVFFLAGCRLLAVDAQMYASPGLYAMFLNARFLTFITAAAALWFAASQARAVGRVEALFAYLGGHLVAIWALVLEVLAWAERSAPGPEVAILESTAVSILLAACAVVLVAIGVRTRSLPDRVAGLALIVVVVAKLYLYDVWQMSRGIYRVAAFAGLGALLLGTSYLYSRYRASIESWWRDRSAR